MNNKRSLLAKKFHFQGYEYQSCYTSKVLEHLISPNPQSPHMFTPQSWTKLTDLSLVNYDWLWNSMADLSMQEVKDYYKNSITFHQAIGQNLPNLLQLELTHPFSLRDDVYFWLFLKFPPAEFSEVSRTEWESGVLGWRKHHHRWIPKVSEFCQSYNTPGTPKTSQLQLISILQKNPELNPVCNKLEHFQIHNSTERLPVLSAILKWCSQLMTSDLPEFDILSDTLAASPEHYRRGFLLPCLFLLKQQGLYPNSTNIRRICIEDPNSVIMTDLWKQHGLDLPPADNLPMLLDLVVQMANKTQDLYLGNNARHAFAGTETLQLSENNLAVLNQLNMLSILELENIEPTSTLRLLERLGSKLKKVTLTNIFVDLGHALACLASATSVELRNTRVVLSDEEDSNQVLEWTEPLIHSPGLTSLRIDYTVPIEVLMYSLTKLTRLSSLSLGHSRQRYSHSSSIAGLTPSLWIKCLTKSNLKYLEDLSIPVLFQPGISPESQVKRFIFNFISMV